VRFQVVPCYFCAGGEAERKKIIDQIIIALRKLDPLVLPRSYNAEETPVSSVMGELETRPLLGKFSIIVFDGIEKLKKAEIQILENYIAKPAPYAHLILGGTTLKITKGVFAFDLSSEKPWEKQNRLKEWMMGVAAKEKKRLTPDLIAYLFARVGPEVAALEQELNKLMTYALDKEVIDVGDGEKLCPMPAAVTSWKLVEMLVVEGKMPPNPPIEDTSSLLAFMGQIRYQLEQGMKKGGRKPFFVNALKELFHLEVQVKTLNVDPRVLYDIFAAKLIRSRRT